jgi:hypothetical protein
MALCQRCASREGRKYCVRRGVPSVVNKESQGLLSFGYAS